MRHTITQQIDDLNKVDWIFIMMEHNYGDSAVFLENMYVMKRDSTRHKYRIDNDKSYGRVHGRDMGVKQEPEVPMDIAVDAVQHMRKQIVFKKWGSK